MLQCARDTTGSGDVLVPTHSLPSYAELVFPAGSVADTPGNDREGNQRLLRQRIIRLSASGKPTEIGAGVNDW